MYFKVGQKYQHLIASAKCACCTQEVQAFTTRVMTDLSRRGFLAGMVASVSSLGLPDLARAQTAPQPAAPRAAIMFRNLKLFDGKGQASRAGQSVLVQGNKIVDVVAGDAKAPDGATVIDCGGRTLMPGLIDAHWHAMLATTPVARMMAADIGTIHYVAAADAEKTLLRGFTSVRDLGGPAFALKKAIDSGLIVGPRIFPAGAIISQTSGHGDFRSTHELPRRGSELNRSEEIGAARIVDSPDQVRRATREQLMQGATQIKLAAGGGIASDYDPIDVTQFRAEEIRAAVEAAEDWGTYVAAHVYTPVGIKRCLQAGVKSIEHGQLADEEAMKMMADKGAVWCPQPFLKELNTNLAMLPPAKIAKWELVWEGTARAYEFGKKHKVKTGWGSDALFDKAAAEGQGTMLAALGKWFSPAQALQMATSINAEILSLSGPRMPYDGKLGVIEKGAFADLLIVDGDPTADLGLVANPEKNFRLIMKDGRIHKNTL